MAFFMFFRWLVKVSLRMGVSEEQDGAVVGVLLVLTVVFMWPGSGTLIVSSTGKR